MIRKLRYLFATAVVAVSALLPSPLDAQAFTLPQGVGAVTVAGQYVDNTGHRLSDGFLRQAGESVTASAVFEVDYGFTDRFSLSFAIPYVFAKYTGALPPPSGRAVDACSCWHSSFQDFSLAARFRLGNDTWAVTPHLRYVLPSHDYPYQGEAVVGRNLYDTQIGVSAGAKLSGFLSRASLQAVYSYAFPDRVAGVSMDRSNFGVDFGYALTRRLFARVAGIYQHTHGGLRFGSPTGDPFFPPGEVNTPERFAQRDRLLKTRYWQVAGGLSYSAGPADLFASYAKYVWGRDAHDGHVYTVGATWYFDLAK